MSALNSLIWKIGDTNKERKIGYFNKKYLLLIELKIYKLADEVLGEIMKIDPSNIELKREYIKKVFDRGNIWEGFTEFMRY